MNKTAKTIGNFVLAVLWGGGLLALSMKMYDGKDVLMGIGFSALAAAVVFFASAAYDKEHEE